MRGQKRFQLMLLILVAAMLAAGSTGFCATPKNAVKTVAVFPFTMNSSEDLGFLQNGLFSILSSRLTNPGKVDVLDRDQLEEALAKVRKLDSTKGEFNEAKARIIGADLGVDYVLFGSLTLFGDSISVDARMVDVSGQKDSFIFIEQSNAMGDAIHLVNSFAEDINVKLFNRHMDNGLYAKPRPREKSPVPDGHQYSGGAGVYGGGTMAVQEGQRFSVHLKVNDVIRAMAVKDLDNDGTLQIVTATDSNLMIYHLQGSTLVLEKTLEYASYLRIVGLDIADINNNGYPEIFVSATTVHRNNLASFVVEYNGSAYVTLVEGESCYYRVVTTKDNTQVLLSQDKGKDPFSGRIYTMSPANRSYREEKRLRLPRGTSVLSLARGAVSSQDGDEYMTVNRHNRLVLASNTGNTEWESTNKYGKTNNFWFMPLQGGADATYRERVYFNPRIVLHPVGEDRQVKAFIVQNNEIVGGALGQIKRFKEGSIEIMGWNGIALAPIFQTMSFQGWISDLAVADLDGDGEEELVISVVNQAKLALFSRDKSSNIISYKIRQ